MSINGAMLTKTLGSGPVHEQDFTDTSERLIDLEVRSQLAGRWRIATMSIVFAAIPALLYLVAGFPALSGELSIGTLIAFASLQGTIFRPIMGLLNLGAQWIASMALLSRIFGYLDLPVEVPEPQHPVRLKPADVRGEVRFEQVSYHFPDGVQDALSGIDLTVDPATGLRVQEYLVERGSERRLVHYWYRSHRRTGMLGGLDQNIDRVLGQLGDGRSDGALVTLSTVLGRRDVEATRGSLIGFAAALDPLLAERWPDEHPESDAS